jgi:hypothetical protein
LASCTEFAESPWRTDLRLILEGKGAWPDLKNRPVEHITKGIQVAGVGDEDGSYPVVRLRVDLSDGRAVVVETSLRLFYTAAQALVARYGKPT